jgi:hypothetical protein
LESGGKTLLWHLRTDLSAGSFTVMRPEKRRLGGALQRAARGAEIWNFLDDFVSNRLRTESGRRIATGVS